MLTMPQTSGYSDLSVEEEAKYVEQTAIAMGSHVEVVQYPSREKALQLFDEYSTIFLGCHGETDPRNPSNSGILVASGPGRQPEKLTVRDVATKALSNALLVYFSACSTAENSSQGLMDEVIHLASTLQSIGFPHVVGTMWQVEDEPAKLIARLFFENIARQASADETQAIPDFALALHQAVEHVRRNASEHVTT
jgi:CHAT domain-containing protein